MHVSRRSKWEFLFRSRRLDRDASSIRSTRRYTPMSWETAFDGKEGEVEEGGGEGCSTFSFSRVVNTPRPGQVGFRGDRVSTGFREHENRGTFRLQSYVTASSSSSSNVHGEIGGAGYKSTETYSYFTCPALSSPNFFPRPRRRESDKPACKTPHTHIRFPTISSLLFPRISSPRVTGRRISSERKFDSLYRVYLSALFIYIYAFSWRGKREMNYSPDEMFRLAEWKYREKFGRDRIVGII